MYRRNVAQTPRPQAQAAAASTIMSAVFDVLAKTGLWDAAWRENRQRARNQKQAKKHVTYFRSGLNGQQAMDRRRRQIAGGQLTTSNGLEL